MIMCVYYVDLSVVVVNCCLHIDLIILINSMWEQTE